MTVDPFEQEMRDALRRLADTAPAGPGPDDPDRHLRRQARRLLMGILGVAVILTAGILWLAMPDPAPDRTVSRVTPAMEEEDLRETLQRYFSSRGTVAAEIEKRRGEEVAITVRGPADVDMKRWRADLDALLEKYEYVDLSLREGRVRYLGAVRR